MKELKPAPKMTKEERTAQTRRIHPDTEISVPRNMNVTQILVTPEMLTTIIEMYPYSTSAQMSEVLNISSQSVNTIIQLLKSKGVKLVRDVRGIKKTFESAFEQMKNK